MSIFKKPEIIILIAVVVALIAYVVYDYRRISSQDEKINEIRMYSVATIRNLEKYTRTFDQMVEEIKDLKVRLDDLEEIDGKYSDLHNAFEDLLDELKEKGIEVEVELEANKKKKKKHDKKKPKRSKRNIRKSKKEKRDKESSEEEDSSEDDSSSEALERISRIQERRRNKK